jgi:chromatin structure-remodeling complex protein RSC7
VTTFTLPERSNTEKLYMLGIDVAKAAGHTDSSLLARRYHSLVKAYLTDSEKVLLLETGIGSGSNFRNDRPVTIYAARNIYKYMGAAIIKSEIVLSDHHQCRCTHHLRPSQTGVM